MIMTDDPTAGTFWLSFANEYEFGGVNIIDLSEDEIGEEKWICAAIDKTIALGINPGPDYSVRGQRVPAHHAIPTRFKNRLLNEEDAQEAQLAATLMN
jgi:hypothetical protein